MSKDSSLRNISIRSIRKNPPDYTKLGRALIQLAQAKAEAEAQAEKENNADSSVSPTNENQLETSEDRI